MADTRVSAFFFYLATSPPPSCGDGDAYLSP